MQTYLANNNTIPDLPLDIYGILAQKINDVNTLINYLNTCKIFRNLVSAYDNNINFIKLPRCYRIFTTYLEYLYCYRFTINIVNFKSYQIFGLVTDLPLNLLEKMTFGFQHEYIDFRSAPTMLIIDHKTHREIVFDDSDAIFKCK